MDWHRISLRLASPTLTPWQADTIFGHLCWALAYLEGPGYLDVFLGLYDLGEPPLVISDGFPGDLLPRPLLAARPPKRASLDDQRADFRQSKQAKEARLLTPDEFEQACGGQIVRPTSQPSFPKQSVSMHNQISRLTGTTGPQGTLYSLEELALDEAYGGRLSIYALVSPDFVSGLRRCLAYLQASGYGKRKSAGYGAIAEARLEPFAGFPELEGANGFISLSSFVPAAGDPARGAWNTLVKRGKLGEEYATAGNPFKRPVLMLTAGSCFYDRPVRPYYGRLVHDVHPDYPEVVQYGLALAVSARLPEGEALA